MSGDIPPLGAYESGVASGIDEVTMMPLALDIRQKKKKMKEEQYQKVLEEAKREGKRVGITRLVGEEEYTPIRPIDPEAERIREQMLKSVSAGEVGPSRRGRSSRDYELQSYPLPQTQWPPKRFTSNPLNSREFAALRRLHQSYLDEVSGDKAVDLRVEPRAGDWSYGFYEGIIGIVKIIDHGGGHVCRKKFFRIAHYFPLMKK